MLPFTAEVFFSLISQYNRAIWPAPLIGWLLCLIIVGMTFRPPTANGRITASLLALMWAWIAIVFHQLHFAPLFFAAPLLALLFGVQAALLAWSGLLRKKVSFRFRTGPVGGAGLGLVIFSLFCWPLVDWVAHGEWWSVRVAGTAPSPTAAFTIGILLLTDRAAPLHLALAPLAWSLIGGAGAWVLSLPEALSLPLAGIAGFALIAWKNRRPGRANPGS